MADPERPPAVPPPSGADKPAPGPPKPADHSATRTSGEFEAAGDDRLGAGTPEHLSPASTKSTFAEGQLVADRYRVVRFIARGGMGEVYEVADQALGERLALKTIRPEVARDPRALERFKREIRVARQISHPNVCRIHEFWTHKAAEESGAGDVFFLTMELLHGETLATRISRGRLSSSEALEIVVQLALGLDAAHALGIIHRDFKSSNVMLVPAKDPAHPPRAVVTDFGLARGFAPDAALVSISETGAIVGTLAYMAPEQVEGKPLTPAADLYALGVVVYEMFTGLRPFTGDSPLSVAVKRLTELPVPPHIHVPDLDPVWESVIMRCLERDPSARFGSGREIVHALSPLHPPGREVLPPSSAARAPSPVEAAMSSAPGSAVKPVGPTMLSRRALWVAGAAVAILALGWGSLHLLKRRPAGTTPEAAASTAPAVAARPAIAVLGFKNATGRAEAGWLGTAFSEMILSDLTAGGDLRAIPAEDVARARREQTLGELETLSKELGARVRASLGADLVVLGSYTTIGTAGSRVVRLDVRLQNASTAEVLAAGPATGTEGELFELVARAVAPLREKLGLGRVSAAQELRLKALLPANPDAARLYSEGLAKLRATDAVGARKALEGAITLDAGHPLPHAALAEVWIALGYRPRAESEMQKAASLSGSLPEEQRIAIEARRLVLARESDKAVESYRSLLALHPDDLDSGLRMVDVLIETDKGREAIQAIESLRTLPPTLADDPRIDLAEARASYKMGDFKRQQTMAVRAAEKARSSGSKLLLARARMSEAAALIRLGSGDQASAAAEDARQAFDSVGDRGGVAATLEHMAVALNARGDVDGALRLNERALGIRRELGDDEGVARVTYNVAISLMGKGQSAEAQRRIEECLVTFQRIGADDRAASAVNALGAQLEAAGDLAGAEKRYRQALSIFSRIGQKPGVALALGNVGDVLFVRGDLAGAQDMHAEALAMNREIGDKTGAAYDLRRLGDILVAKGDLRVARDRIDEALAMQSQNGERLAAAETRLSLAALTLAEGRSAEAEAMAREAEEVLRAESAADGAALAQILLADCLLAQGKAGEAERELEKARGVAAETGSQQVAFRVATVGGRLSVRKGKGAEADSALAALAAAAAKAQKAGRIGQRFEALLALHEAELELGKAASGKAGLTALARDASAKGFGLIARKAELALDRPAAPPATQK